MYWFYWVTYFFFLEKTLSEKETEARSLQEQTVQLQSELSRLRQDLQDRTTQEEQLRQQITEKDEKTRKAIVAAKSKIAHLAGNFMYMLRLELHTKPIQDRRKIKYKREANIVNLLDLLNFNFFKTNFLIYVYSCLFVCVHVCTTCVSGIHRGQRRC